MVLFTLAKREKLACISGSAVRGRSSRCACWKIFASRGFSLLTNYHDSRSSLRLWLVQFLVFGERVLLLEGLARVLAVRIHSVGRVLEHELPFLGLICVLRERRSLA